MTFQGRLAFIFLFLGAAPLFAQSTPTVTQMIPARSATAGGAPISIDLRNHFGLPSVAGQVAQFNTVLGRFNVELRADVAPQHVTNFLNYAQSGAYNSSFFHRSAVFTAGVAIVQGGGYRIPLVTTITKNAPVPLEYNLPNSRGTLAAARTSDINSATSEWYFNVQDNSTTLGTSNGGGYSVFGRVVGSGMTVVDAIAAVPRYNAGGAFTDLPLRNYVANTEVSSTHMVLVNGITVVPIYPPDGGGASVLTFTVQNTNDSVASASISGSTLNVIPGAQSGTASLTVRATDTNGSFAITAFGVTTTGASVAPAIVRSTGDQVVSAGGSVVFEVTASGTSPTYQWRRDGQPIAGATGNLLLLRSVSQASAGVYTVAVTNAIGEVISTGSALTVSSTGSKGRLSNLSVRSIAGLGSQTLTAGFTLSGSGNTSLVMRGIGPTLGVFGVTGFLADPRLELFNASQALVASNEDWVGVDGSAVGGFALPLNSKDAVLSSSLAVGGFTAQVKGAGVTTGEALMELYEAPQANPTSELINLSARTQLDGGQILTTGFSISSGTHRTVLVRAVGPGLGALGVPGTLANPRIELFAAGGVKIGENDDWGGSSVLSETMASVGAFGIADLASRDAMILATLPPGGYTAQVTGVAGVSGVVIVELYVVP